MISSLLKKIIPAPPWIIRSMTFLTISLSFLFQRMRTPLQSWTHKSLPSHPKEEHLQKTTKLTHENRSWVFGRKILTSLPLSLFLSLFLSFLWPSLSSAQISIGGKIFTEQNILVDLISQLLENEGYKTQKYKNLGGPFVAFEALKKGDIDLYVEYSGTAYHTIYNQAVKAEPKKAFQWLKDKFQKDGFDILEPLGFSNSYAIFIPQNFLPEIQTISALRSLSPSLKMGITPEFNVRPDGYKNLTTAYNLKFKSLKVLDIGLLYEALNNGQIDLGMGYVTDGRNYAYKLRQIKDDKEFFPHYLAFILIRTDCLKKHPQLLGILNRLSHRISQEEMTLMNYKVDVLKEPSFKVAQDFLISKNLISTKYLKRFSSSPYYLIKNRSLLIEKTLEHIYISFFAFLFTLLIGLFLGIMCLYSKKAKTLIFIFTNFFQTVPSLALFGFLIPFLGIGFLPSLVALVMYGLLPLVHNVYTGLNEIEPDIIDSCRAIGMTPFEILIFVRFPISLPTLGAGLRTSIVIIIGTTTIAAFIGAGGLGDLIFQGISALDYKLILLGAIPAALLALLADFILQLTLKALSYEKA